MVRIGNASESFELGRAAESIRPIWSHRLASRLLPGGLPGRGGSENRGSKTVHSPGKSRDRARARLAIGPRPPERYLTAYGPRIRTEGTTAKIAGVRRDVGTAMVGPSWRSTLRFSF